MRRLPDRAIEQSTASSRHDSSHRACPRRCSGFWSESCGRSSSKTLPMSSD